jgi:hypothetical protein
MSEVEYWDLPKPAKLTKEEIKRKKYEIRTTIKKNRKFLKKQKEEVKQYVKEHYSLEQLFYYLSELEISDKDLFFLKLICKKHHCKSLIDLLYVRRLYHFENEVCVLDKRIKYKYPYDIEKVKQKFSKTTVMLLRFLVGIVVYGGFDRGHYKAIFYRANEDEVFTFRSNVFNFVHDSFLFGAIKGSLLNHLKYANNEFQTLKILELYNYFYISHKRLFD